MSETIFTQIVSESECQEGRLTERSSFCLGDFYLDVVHKRQNILAKKEHTPPLFEKGRALHPALHFYYASIAVTVSPKSSSKIACTSTASASAKVVALFSKSRTRL